MPNMSLNFIENEKLRHRFEYPVPNNQIQDYHNIFLNSSTLKITDSR